MEGDVPINVVVERVYKSIQNSVTPFSEKAKWISILMHCQKYGKYSYGNRITLYDDGDEAFTSMFKAIDSAKERVWLETYILDDSSLSATIVDKLRQASRRGCDVIAIIDSFGGLSMRKSTIDCLNKDGVNVIMFNDFFGSEQMVGPLVFRDHRKLLICDTTAFCGSMNVSVDAGGKMLGNDRFYDIHAKVEGPSVSHLAEVFFDTLQESGSNINRLPIPFPKPFEDGCYVQVLESNVQKKKRSIQSTLDLVVREASSSVFLTTSYFHPPAFLRRSILEAAKNGVLISLLLSGNSDVIGDVLASTHLLRKLLVNSNNKIRPYLMTDKHCHAKTLVVDDVWSSIGSFNWDRYSSRRNLEVLISVFDYKVAQKVKAFHENKLNGPHVNEASLSKLQQANILSIAISACAYKIVSFMGKNFLDGLSNNTYKNRIKRSIICSYLDKQVGINIAASLAWGVH